MKTTMKRNSTALLALGLAAIYGLAACGGDKDHDHDDHEDHKGHDHKGAAHDDGKQGADAPEDHDHDQVIAGPNGGRVLTGVEPHAEFFVMDDRKVQIAFVGEDIKAIPAAEQVVTVVAGERSDPTNLKFEKVGDVLISDKPLPDGNDFPVIVQIKTSADAKSVREKFNVNLDQCPTCKYKEYACTCEHGEDE